MLPKGWDRTWFSFMLWDLSFGWNEKTGQLKSEEKKVEEIV